MMKNSNEKRHPHTPESEDGFDERNPRQLYNKFSTNDYSGELTVEMWNKLTENGIAVIEKDNHNVWYCSNFG